MPNHVTNTLIIIGTEAQINAVLEFILGDGEDNYIEFNNIVPQPPEVLESIGANELGNGDLLWYEWRLDNWGTKWEAYDQMLIEENVLQFDTAWSMPEPIYIALSNKFPEIDFEVEWSDEDSSYNCGVGKYRNGEAKINEYEGGSKEAYEIYFKLHSGMEAYYKFNEETGTYDYIDEDEEESEPEEEI